MSNTETVRRILNEIQYATIATVNENGDPWNTPVFCAVDGKFNIYWSSHPESEHSKNIVANHKAFISIYNSKAAAGEGQGVYLETNVVMLANEGDIVKALALLGERQGKVFHNPAKFSRSGSQRVYRASPTKAWINDADQDEDGDFIRDYRIPVDLG